MKDIIILDGDWNEMNTYSFVQFNKSALQRPQAEDIFVGDGNFQIVCRGPLGQYEVLQVDDVGQGDLSVKTDIVLDDVGVGDLRSEFRAAGDHSESGLHFLKVFQCWGRHFDAFF